MDDVLRREREIHDRLAEAIDPNALPPMPPADLEGPLLDRLPDLTGLHVLDLGCGQGDLTLLLAQRGANVTALDISPGMVGVVEQRLRQFVPDADVACIAGPAETVPRPDASFDLIVGKWILHHTDLSLLAPELARLLRPGGRAVFIENSGLNPVLRFARDHVAGRAGVARMGTPDEHPLVEADYDTFAASFRRVERHYPRFDMFKLFDRQVFRYRSPAVSRVCNGLDRTVERRAPALMRYSFRVIVELWA